MTTSYAAYLTVAMGLEDLLADEIRELLSGVRLKVKTGGIELRLTREQLWALAHQTRVAESIRVRVGRFTARTWSSLEAGLRRVPWAAYIGREDSPPLSVSARKSKLIHTQAIEDRVRAVLGPRHNASAIPVYVRLSKDQVVVSVDAVGERLHRRGGGKHVGAAPLRETLAAACLRASGYTGEEALWDPFCGSGTFLTEALDLAGVPRIGGGREFAFTTWPSHDPGAYAEWRTATPERPNRSGRVCGSDLDKRVLQAAEHNLSVFDTSRWHLEHGDFAKVGAEIPAGTWIITNLPYGKRLALTPGLLKRWGVFLRRRGDLGPVFVLSASADLEARTGLSWQRVREFRHGGLRVILWRHVTG